MTGEALGRRGGQRPASIRGPVKNRNGYSVKDLWPILPKFKLYQVVGAH
jgi:hypothetical protein